MSLSNFKSFSIDRLDVDEMVALLAFGKSLRAEYESLQIEEPEFVSTQINTLKREIRAKLSDKLEAKKRELAARIDSLKTPAQKKNELEAELKRIESQLVGV